MIHQPDAFPIQTFVASWRVITISTARARTSVSVFPPPSEIY
jgi:hypothetical protein